MRFNSETFLAYGNWLLLGSIFYLAGSIGGELLYWQILRMPVSSLAPGTYSSTSISPDQEQKRERFKACLLYTSPSPRDVEESRMPSSA